MKISHLKANSNATLEEVEVIEKGEVREFLKFDKPGRVCNAKIEDDSGDIQLTLWNDEIDTVETGDKLKITDGWVKEWNGQLQVSRGKNGKIEKL
ncbi:MAG: DNA-binding protein [Candidatus Aenigmarchaeota archaeon]|nr:DNA-binding protein [Candidatus Aenigmarchaeota archaeon]